VVDRHLGTCMIEASSLSAARANRTTVFKCEGTSYVVSEMCILINVPKLY